MVDYSVVKSLFGAMWLAAVTGGTCASDESTLIRNARIFDGERVIDATDLLIRGDAIARLGLEIEAPEGAIVIDADGAFLMPGLIDCHTHTFDASMLEQSLIFGVTTNLDMFTAISVLETIRAVTEPGRADIFSSGTLVTAPGGHGTQFGLPIPTISDPEQADAFVADRLAEGSDYIKIVYDDGSELGMSIPTVSPETLAAVIKAAHDRDSLAIVHIHAYEAACTTIERNADGLVHTFIDTLPDDRLESLMIEHGAFMIPTLAVIESVCGRRGGATLIEDKSLAEYLGPAQRRALSSTFPIAADGPKRDYEVAKRSVAELHDAGVPILAGTDAPNPGTAHGVSIHRELELLVQAGLEPIEALRAATSIPAESFQLNDRGRIVPGRNADLVLIDGDPTQDVTHTRRIIGVWKLGRRLDRTAWKTTVADANEAADRIAVKRGLVSDFDGEAITTEFGAGWSVSTDAMMGGASTAEMKRIDGGADGSAGALRVVGSISDASQFPWAGVMFCPADQVFQPYNLSANDGFSFHARGDGRTYRVLVFAETLGRIPAERTFDTTEEWAEHTFSWTDFRGIDGSDIMAIIISAGTGADSFWFEIDQFRLK